MSRYDSFQTQFKNQEALVSALKKLYPEVEVYAEPRPLVDYLNKMRPDEAHVIVRRHHLTGSSNDLGFIRRKDGTFNAIISEYDKNTGLDAKWLGALTQSYNQLLLGPHLQRTGFFEKQRKVQANGDIHVVMSRMR